MHLSSLFYYDVYINLIENLQCSTTFNKEKESYADAKDTKQKGYKQSMHKAARYDRKQGETCFDKQEHHQGFYNQSSIQGTQ